MSGDVFQVQKALALKYRPDIDGLRAIAVVAVVLFHAGVPGFAGGYVGVDVFYVISGYLITSLILAQQEKGQFTLLWFYERRIRRIFPALFVVMFACAVMGWLVMAPNDYKSLGGSIFATSIFLSNVLFWWRSGYFEADAQDQPLLHTWSLAVEEQYYLGFPLLMMLLTTIGKKSLVRIIMILTSISFVSCSIVVFYSPASAFYLSPFRAWELFLGSFLVAGIFPSSRRINFRNYCSIFGLGMIFVAVALYSKETLFPGIAALLPACGTALFIWAGAGALPIANRLIAAKPMVFVGKISYSLYLWHYVLLAFGSYLTIGSMAPTHIAILLAVSLALAVLSWLMIEQPVRRATSPLFQGRALFGATGVVIAGMALVGWTIRAENGFEARVSAGQLSITTAESETSLERSDCIAMSPSRAKSGQFCKLGSVKPSEPSFFVWGDSHAMALHSVLGNLAKKQGAAGLLAPTGGCPPLLNIVRRDPAAQDCAGINQNIFEFIVAEKSIKNVILIGRWAIYTEGTSYKDQPINRFNPAYYIVENKSVPESKSMPENVAVAFDQTVSALLAAKKRIWIVGPVPEVEVNIPKALYLQSLGIGRGHKLEPAREDFDRRQAHVIPILEAVAQRYPVHVAWPHIALCNQKICNVEARGKPLYVDTNHLSSFGANFIEPTVGSIKMK